MPTELYPPAEGFCLETIVATQPVWVGEWRPSVAPDHYSRALVVVEPGREPRICDAVVRRDMGTSSWYYSAGVIGRRVLWMDGFESCIEARKACEKDVSEAHAAAVAQFEAAGRSAAARAAVTKDPTPT